MAELTKYMCADCGHKDSYLKSGMNSRRCKSCGSTNLWKIYEMRELRRITKNKQVDKLYEKVLEDESFRNYLIEKTDQ